MTQEKIKELMLSESKFPFKANDLWRFFGYASKRNFIRYINSKPDSFGYLLKDEIINCRKREEGFLTREMFLKLLEENNLIEDCYYDWFAEYKSKELIKKILHFENIGKKKEYRLKIYEEKISGNFYTYSLTTFNLAKDIDIDPLDLFVFFRRNYTKKFGVIKADILDNWSNPTPYFRFDSLYHTERYLFYICIKELLKDYKLSALQKKILHKYIELIKELLEKQVNIDIKAKRFTSKEEKAKSKNKKIDNLFAPKINNKELKDLYRKTAVLCHPDKNINGEELFKKLNNANKNRDLSEMKKIHKACQNI